MIKNIVREIIAVIDTFLKASLFLVYFIIGIKTPIPSKKNKLTPSVLGTPFGINIDVSLNGPSIFIF